MAESSATLVDVPEEWERRVAENAQRYQELQRQLDSLSVTEKSSDGNVEVTVSATGRLTGLVLREPWEPTPLARIAGEIMKTMERAQGRIPDLLEQAVDATVGNQDPGARTVVADARARFPATAPARKVARPASAGEDWESKPILEDV